MKTFKYFGSADWQAHLRVQTEQMQYLAQWLNDNGKIPSLPDVRKWEDVSFVPKQ